MELKYKVLTVDDHAVFREGLVQILRQDKNLIICGEASDGAEALKQIDKLKPDLVIVDISMEDMNGLDLTKSIRSRYPQIRILVLSMHKESIYAERALKAGANGYLMKRESGAKLLSAIRRVLQGHISVSEELNELLLHRVSNSRHESEKSPIETLSDRELEIFQLIGQGFGTRQMADKLSLSMKTVETHKEHIRNKLQLKGTFELVQYAIHWVHAENRLS